MVMPPRDDLVALTGALFLYPFRARNPLTGNVVVQGDCTTEQVLDVESRDAKIRATISDRMG